MTTASDAEEAERLAAQTYKACEQWRSEDPQPAWLTPTSENSRSPENNQPQTQSTVEKDTPVLSARSACSPVDFSEVHESVRQYARGVACIQADNRQGTGFVIRNTDSGEGYLLTNAHVVGVDPDSVVVYLENVAYNGELIRANEARDLAMVRICCGEFVVLKRTNRGVRFGEWVGALGFPGGKFSVDSGVARATFDRTLNTYIEHTADVKPGGSGGPLLTFPLKAVFRAVDGKGLNLEEGEVLAVIGVTSAKSLEHEFTTYTIYQGDVIAFVDSTWGGLGLKLAERPSLSDGFDVYTVSW
ncbi:MAG: serine protease [Chloroflexi bacterium]|nr:serine protease [Chloroflexota bacterium]